MRGNIHIDDVTIQGREMSRADVQRVLKSITLTLRSSPSWVDEAIDETAARVAKMRDLPPMTARMTAFTFHIAENNWVH